MSFLDKDVRSFTDVLSTKAPVPGGGGASALVGAVGIALGNMVGDLTVGKPKYADVEDEVKGLMKQCEEVRANLLSLIDADAEAFEPLSKAYGIPKDDPTRDEVMEKALRVACDVPMDIMREVGKAIDLLERMGQIGTAIAISDVGVGATCCKAAIKGASLNVFINTKSMKDKDYAKKLEDEANALLDKYCAKADEVYDAVFARIRG
ncbi:MAG: cyclodeaminase/cyclohydrolase family protein [Coriobacteriales bacterium]|jgi:formiminotetrahydrofolate cyclodeaminase